MTTAVTILLFVGAFLLQVLTWVFLFRTGLRWAQLKSVTMRRIVCTLGLIFISNALLVILINLARPGDPAHPWTNLVRGQPISQVAILFAFLEYILLFFVNVFVIAFSFKVSLLRALRIWTPRLVNTPAWSLFALLVVRPFLFEAFFMPTNSMAPTLLGRHWVGTCAECDSPAYCSPPYRMNPYENERSTEMICRDNFHVSRIPADSDHVFNGDRYLVTKFLKPKRWDLVVFRAPPSLQHEKQDTPAIFVMRLVGLPGEEVTIKEGQVWIDGQVLTPPAAIHGIKYDTDLNHSPGYVWGSADSPAKLGDDEYYVLGDFSRNSYDSRYWPEGKNREKPFAVPKSDIQGVVSHIYWPLSRWRAFK